MESKYNNINNEEKKQQNTNTRKRKFNELATDEGQPQEEERERVDQNLADDGKNQENEGDGRNNLELKLESLSREDLLKLVMEMRQELGEKSNQIGALHEQLNELRNEQQIVMPIRQMKVQLPRETWFDLLAFVPRRYLGGIIPPIGNRQFAKIAQSFLHKYGEHTLNRRMEIVAPYEEDPWGCPRVQIWQKQIDRYFCFKLAHAQMPTNMKDFWCIKLSNIILHSYMDKAVFDFLQKFQQNGLMENVNLSIYETHWEIIRRFLPDLLPKIDSFHSIHLSMDDISNFWQINDDNDEGGNEFTQMARKMLAETRILKTFYDDDDYPDDDEYYKYNPPPPNKIDLLCQWLYHPLVREGIPWERILFLNKYSDECSPIALFIDRIKQDFLMAIHPVSFIIRIHLPGDFQRQPDISIENGKTNERLVTKIYEVRHERPTNEYRPNGQVALLVSRYWKEAPTEGVKNFEKQILRWEFDWQWRRIYFEEELDEDESDSDSD